MSCECPYAQVIACLEPLWVPLKLWGLHPEAKNEIYLAYGDPLSSFGNDSYNTGDFPQYEIQ